MSNVVNTIDPKDCPDCKHWFNSGNGERVELCQKHAMRRALYNMITYHRFWVNLCDMSDAERKALHEKWHKSDVEFGMGHVTYMSAEDIKKD